MARRETRYNLAKYLADCDGYSDFEELSFNRQCMYEEAAEKAINFFVREGVITAWK